MTVEVLACTPWTDKFYSTKALYPDITNVFCIYSVKYVQHATVFSFLVNM